MHDGALIGGIGGELEGRVMFIPWGRPLLTQRNCLLIVGHP
jgi:hypothetical protein